MRQQGAIVQQQATIGRVQGVAADEAETAGAGVVAPAAQNAHVIVLVV